MLFTCTCMYFIHGMHVHSKVSNQFCSSVPSLWLYWHSSMYFQFHSYGSLPEAIFWFKVCMYTGKMYVAKGIQKDFVWNITWLATYICTWIIHVHVAAYAARKEAVGYVFFFGRCFRTCLYTCMGHTIWHVFWLLVHNFPLGLVMLCGLFINGPYAVITTAVSNDLVRQILQICVCS